MFRLLESDDVSRAFFQFLRHQAQEAMSRARRAWEVSNSWLGLHDEVLSPGPGQRPLFAIGIHLCCPDLPHGSLA